MDRWTVEGAQTIELEEVSDLRIRLVRGHVDVVGTDGPPRVEVYEVEGDPLVVTSEAGRLSVGYEDLGAVFDFESGSAKEALSGLGEALRDLLRNGRTEGAQEWAQRFPWFGRRRTAVVSIAVPRSCLATVNVVSASAVVAGLAGRTNIMSVSGDVTLDGLSGPVDAHTVSGALEAQVLSAPLSFVTVSGDLTVVDTSSDHIQGRTVSGDLAADLDLEAGGRIELSSVSGDVTVRLAEDTGARVHVSTTSGDATSGFDGLRAERRPGRHQVAGVLGDGSGKVNVSTVSGDVHLLPRRRPSQRPARDLENA